MALCRQKLWLFSAINACRLTFQETRESILELVQPSMASRVLEMPAIRLYYGKYCNDDGYSPETLQESHCLTPHHLAAGRLFAIKKTSWHALWHWFNSEAKVKIKSISFEPPLKDVAELPGGYGAAAIQKADWIVVGSQTKPCDPPKIERAKALIEAADEAGKPVFFKDNLKPLMGVNLRRELPVG